MTTRAVVRGTIVLIALLAFAARAADSQMTEFSGKVVDDETGKPVTDFAVQKGLAPDADSPIKWGYGLSTSSNRHEGKFNESSGWQPGQRVGLRIIADGYVPQPVTAEPVTAPAKVADLVVRMKRGVELRGTVVDAAGKPVDQARLFLANAQPLEIEDGKSVRFKGSTATTDVSGEFALTGLDPGGENRVVVAAGGLVALASSPELDKPLTITLPEPATLIVKFDIANDLPEAALRIELKTWEMKGWEGINIVRQPVVKNGGQIELADLSPGSYDFVRNKTVRSGNMGWGKFLDRKTLDIKAGDKQSIDLVRKGRSITGEIVGMKAANVPDALITIASPEVESDPRRERGLGQLMLPRYDALSCPADDPHFKTAVLEPGAYKVMIEAYQPEPPGQGFRSGIRLPDFVEEVMVTVTKDEDPKPLRIELKSRLREGAK